MADDKMWEEFLAGLRIPKELFKHPTEEMEAMRILDREEQIALLRRRQAFYRLAVDDIPEETRQELMRNGFLNDKPERSV